MPALGLQLDGGVVRASNERAGRVDYRLVGG
jgi:hypothetical protein